jgi:hypothetical protein
VPGMGGFSCGRTKLGGCYNIEHLALSRPQGRRIESEAGNFEEINGGSPRSPFLANFRFVKAPGNRQSVVNERVTQ